MDNSADSHTFHIPVMGTSYTIDTPLKVARYGIDSVVSIIDDRLMETMRAHHSEQMGKPYVPIEEDEDDSRCRRITAYLDFLHDTVNEQFKKLRESPFEPQSEITRYFEMLPDTTPLKQDYLHMLVKQGAERDRLQAELRHRIKPGAIDVNIMTKVDGVSYDSKKGQLPPEFNDAHAAMRGFAQSKLRSSVVLSAGLNPRLYGYITQFPDFLPDDSGMLKKRIILKVSDYRSALIQGKFLAKKGIWISEYRIESGLNCGGHAFATDGHLMGGILQDFKDKRGALVSVLFELYHRAIRDMGGGDLAAPPPVSISAQGGIGTAAEHEFLKSHYDLRSVGWGSPFLLVPEAVQIDSQSLSLLENAREDQYYRSNVSPLGVPFNTIRNSSSERQKQTRIAIGKPGSPCFKKHLASSTEFGKRPLCTASRQYQNKKIKELKATISDQDELEQAINKVTEKMCLCVGLGNAALINTKSPMYRGMHGVSICPGPNLAYFNRVASLHEMIDHIYGRVDLLETDHRPHVFIKELRLYVEYYFEKLGEYQEAMTGKLESYLGSFQKSLNESIEYYRELALKTSGEWMENTSNLLNELTIEQKKLNSPYPG